MADSTAMKVVYKDGIARAQLAGRELTISRHNRDSRKNFCPVELISAALGS